MSFRINNKGITNYLLLVSSEEINRLHQNEWVFKSNEDVSEKNSPGNNISICRRYSSTEF